MVDLVSHMTLKQDLSDLGMTWSFPLWFPVHHDARARGTTWFPVHHDARARGTMWFPMHHDATAHENDVEKAQECDRKIFGDC